MAAKHTPGPWAWDGKVWDYDKSNEAPWLVSEPIDAPGAQVVLKGEIVCSEADALLIAAAPELLEALQVVAADSRWISGEPNLLKVRAAIAKATA